MSIPRVYGMNNCTTFDESDFESVKELYKMYNEKIESDKFERELPELPEKKHWFTRIMNDLNTNDLNTNDLDTNDLDTNETQHFLRKDIKKDSFYKNQGWKSIDPPRAYKLSGSITTFDPYELEMNDKLPQRIIDNLEQIRKEYEAELTDRDLKKNPFIKSIEMSKLRCPKCCSVNEVSKDSSLFSCICGVILSPPTNIPKPPPKWEAHKDSDGDTYYYNVVTKVTQWEKPTEF